MNFEQLCKMIKENNHRLKNKDSALIFMNNIIRILKKNIKKLKLGKIVFEFKKIVYADIVIHEEVEIRYVRQDTTKDDETKIDNRLEALKWRWDFKNIMALTTVIILGLILLYAQINVWYCNNFPAMAYRDPDLNFVIYHSFELTLSGPSIGMFKNLANINYAMVNNLTYFCVQYDILF